MPISAIALGLGMTSDSSGTITSGSPTPIRPLTRPPSTKTPATISSSDTPGD